MTLTLDTIAALQVARGGANRIIDPAARELAKATLESDKRAALEAARMAAERFIDYTASQNARIEALRTIHWPRARAIRDSLSACDEQVRRHKDTHDEFTLSVREYEDVIIRGIRLATLLHRAYLASAAIGRFPISRADMRTDKRTRFIGSAAARHFTFAGGRDWGSAEFDPSDIVQGAFIRALENGDSVAGVPTFGSMFRWIQVERAHLTRIANAEFSARKRAALGYVENAVDDWPEMTDKHAVRLLGTRNYASLSQHRESLAIAHRDAEMAQLDDAVTFSARKDALASNADAAEREFHVIVSRVLIDGGTIAEIASALNVRETTIIADVHKSREASLWRMDTGIDHSERSIDLHNAAERERAEDIANERHSERLREIEIIRHTVAYATSRR